MMRDPEHTEKRVQLAFRALEVAIDGLVSEMPDDDSATPRWVYICGAVVVLVLVVVIILHLTGNSPVTHVPASDHR